MPRKVSLYLFSAVITVVVFGLVLVATIASFRVVTESPKIEREVIKETTPVQPTEPLPPQEAKVTTVPPAVPAPTTEEKALVIAEVTTPPAITTPATTAPVTIPAPATVTPESLPIEKIAAEYEFHKGMSYVTWTENGYSNVSAVEAMEQLVSLGVQWVALIPTWYQAHYNATDISPRKDKTPSDESLIFAIRKLHALKLKIMLKPHLDLVEGEGRWRGDIAFDTPLDWEGWFDNYTTFILHYANLASQENVELFCIGTELTQTTLTKPQAWRDLINRIKEVYKGKLTYAANWHEEFNQIEFWDMLDYAGIDPYFPLVTSMKPKVEELKSAWQDWIRDIEAWQKKIDKPVIFTEIGYKSSSDATDEPWQHTSVGGLDLQLQVNCYQALLESFWEKPWFYGMYWWHWGVHAKMGGELNRSFTPQNKPAQEVIKEWYSKSFAQKAY